MPGDPADGSDGRLADGVIEQNQRRDEHGFVGPRLWVIPMNEVREYQSGEKPGRTRCLKDPTPMTVKGPTSGARSAKTATHQPNSRAQWRYSASLMSCSRLSAGQMGRVDRPGQRLAGRRQVPVIEVEGACFDSAPTSASPVRAW